VADNMKKSDLTCPDCGAGYQRIELTSSKGASGEYRCLTCDRLLEVFDGATSVVLRLTVQPERIWNESSEADL
jgi:transposase-like protein